MQGCLSYTGKEEKMVTKILVVGSSKFTSGKRRPRIRIAGFWLEEFGFAPDTLIAATLADKNITLTAQGSGIEAYREIVKGIRKNSGQLIQIRNELHNGKRTPHFEMAGLWLSEYGFHIGDVAVVRCSHGRIKITRLDIPPP